MSPSAWLRDERVIAGLAQVVIGLAVIAGLWYLADRTLDDMRARGLVPGTAFLGQTAGFAIGEGPAFEAGADTYTRALAVGLANTLRVAAVASLAATLVGFTVALGRISHNPLSSGLAAAFVELFRNTPLLVQLLFWYQGVVLALPGFADSLAFGATLSPGGEPTALAFLSQRGLALPWLDPGGAGGLDLPRMTRFNYAGGWVLSPEFTALALGLTCYTAAFIAEVVRGGIQAIPRGQRDAARALGLGEGQVLRKVVLPQAVRIIVPPLTSQYLNLAKNSTLAIYVGYPDLFNVSLTIGNNTGQFVVVTALVMAAYLAISLATSIAMHAYQRRARWAAA